MAVDDESALFDYRSEGNELDKRRERESKRDEAVECTSSLLSEMTDWRCERREIADEDRRREEENEKCGLIDEEDAWLDCIETVPQAFQSISRFVFETNDGE